jgi:hypothetical protein
MNLVSEWITRSTPRSSGRVMTGVASVLSTDKSAPASWANDASAARSVSRRIGLQGLSA